MWHMQLTFPRRVGMTLTSQVCIKDGIISQINLQTNISLENTETMLKSIPCEEVLMILNSFVFRGKNLFMIEETRN